MSSIGFRNLAILLGLLLSLAGRPAAASLWPVDQISLPGSPSFAAYDSANGLLYVASIPNGTKISAIDPVSHSVVAAVELWENMRSVAVNPVTNRIYVAGSYHLVVLSGASNAVIASLGYGYVRDVSVNPVTNRVYVISSGTLHIVDGATNHDIGYVLIGGPLWGVGVNTRTNRIYVRRTDDVVVVDGVSNSVVATIGLPPTSGSLDMAVNSDSNMVYVSERPGLLSAVDGASNTVVDTVETPTYPAAIAYRPGLNRVYAACGTDEIATYDGATLHRIGRPVPTHDQRIVSDLALGPGTLLYVPDYQNNVILVYEDRIPPLIIAAWADSNGTIAPSGGVWVDYLADQSFTITPDPGYHVADVLVDQASVGAVTDYTFTRITASHTIEAQFAIDHHTILATAGPHGAIAPGGAVTVADGADQSFAVVPDPHYHVADVRVDGASVGAATSYTFTNVAADHSIEASFAIDTHTLTVLVRGDGVVARRPDQRRYDHGSTVRLAAEAAPGWVFTDWSGDASGTADTLAVLMDSDKTVTATFALEIAFDFKPHDLHLDSKDPWVTGYLRPPEPYLASEIDVRSIRLNATVAVSTEIPAKLEGHDRKLKVKFPRVEVKRTLTSGDRMPVTVTGLIGREAFIGTDEIKVKAEKIHEPRGGAHLASGTVAEVTWDPPEGAASVTLRSSLDDGVSWTVEAESIPNSGSYSWTVPSVVSEEARLEIMQVYEVDETGIVPEAEFAVSDAFSIGATTAAEGGPAILALRPTNPAVGPLSVSFSLASQVVATLAVYDVSGRRVASRELTSGPGWHTMSLGNLPVGVYVVRLSQAGRGLSARVAVIR